RFLRSETHRVTINGLAGDDLFIANRPVPSNIKLKINGGTGKNTYALQGLTRVDVYDDREATKRDKN
ncbi:MAG TPA: hypothetical protein VFL47_12355, partial [Flavisolibacter sp.]|nr:hypothetical protein [Flavisolibacter sp.]